MTRKEFATWAMALKTYYPRDQLLPNPPAMELWFKQLSDIPYKVAELALNKWVATQKWPPTIADIREMAAGITHGESLTWGESWEQAMTAVRRFGSYNQRAALDSLDPLTRKCVESIGFMQLCISENIMVERAHYQKIFETLSKRQLTEQRLPLMLQDAIKQVQIKGIDGQRLQLGEGDST